jgi:hypothetical protein
MMLDLHEAIAMVIIATLPNPCDKRINKSAARIVGPCESLEDLEN